MPVRRDRRDKRRAGARERKTRFAFTFLALFGMVAFFAAMRYVSRPFMDGEQALDVAAPAASVFASLNPWRVVDDPTQTYVAGDGARFDPLAPVLDDAALVDAYCEDAAQDDGAVVNEGETTKPGADFVDLELPAEARDVPDVMDWGRNVELSWFQQTDLSRPKNYQGLDFNFTPTIPGEFASKTLTVDGKPTYAPDATLSQNIIANAAAEATQTQPAKVALNPEDEPRRPEMTPAEKIQPGVALIPSGYRRSGNFQASGDGSMGRVSSISL